MPAAAAAAAADAAVNEPVILGTFVTESVITTLGLAFIMNFYFGAFFFS